MDPQHPVVTIVTPCLNSAPFIASTIESVLSQGYPNVDYILVDGGSTDGTTETIASYVARHPDRMRLIAEPDGGVAEALQKGLAAARGEVFAYLNADDTYYPDALAQAVASLRTHPDAAGVYGNANWIDEDGEVIDSYPTETFSREALAQSCCICQPACFLRTAALREVGGFNTDFQVIFDYELWLRFAQDHHLVRIDSLLASSRMHRANKTLRQRKVGFKETISALRRYNGYVPFRWVHSYASFLIDGRDQFFEPLVPSFPKFIFSLFVGTLINWSSPVRFWKEWIGVMSVDAFVRRWNDSWMARRLGRVIR